MSDPNLQQIADAAGQIAQAVPLVQASIDSLTSDCTALNAQIQTLAAQLAATKKPNLRDLAPATIYKELVAHIEMSSQPHAPGLTFPHPVDMKRWMGFDQHNPDDVAKDVDNMVRTGITCVMPNSYSIGGFEDTSLLLYIPEINRRGLTIFPNIDKGIYGSATNRQTAIQAYIDNRIRKSILPLGNVATWNGKALISFFDDGSTPAATFAAIAKANPDMEFVTNLQAVPGSQYSWMKAALGTGYPAYFDGWLKKYSGLKDGHLYMPHFSPGFDDTLNGHQVWDSTLPPRVYPVGVGPSLDTILWHFTELNKYYSPSNPCEFLMAVTWSDLNEATRICPDVNGDRGYFELS